MQTLQIVYMNLDIWRKIFNLCTLKYIHIQTKMNAYKDFHAFTYLSMVNTCVTDLVLKNKSANLFPQKAG